MFEFLGVFPLRIKTPSTPDHPENPVHLVGLIVFAVRLLPEGNQLLPLRPHLS